MIIGLGADLLISLCWDGVFFLNFCFFAGFSDSCDATMGAGETALSALLQIRG